MQLLGVELAGAGDARQQRDELLAVPDRLALGELVAHVREGSLEPLVHQRLQQVVERVRIEGVDRIPVESSHEDDHRHAGLRDAAQHLESVDARHLDVEEHEVRRVARDRVDRLAPVCALVDDLEVTECAQAELESAPRERLVVDDDGAYRPGHRLQTSSGSRISTQSPGEASATSTEWASPYNTLSRSRVLRKPTPRPLAFATAGGSPGPSSTTASRNERPSMPAMIGDRTALLARRYRVLHRVLDQRLQEQRGHERRLGSLVDVELEPQPVAEPQLLDAEVEVERVELLAQRDLLHRILVERIAQELRQPRDREVRGAILAVEDERRDRIQRVEQEMRDSAGSAAS